MCWDSKGLTGDLLSTRKRSTLAKDGLSIGLWDSSRRDLALKGSGWPSPPASIQMINDVIRMITNVLSELGISTHTRNLFIMINCWPASPNMCKTFLITRWVYPQKVHHGYPGGWGQGKSPSDVNPKEETKQVLEFNHKYGHVSAPIHS